MILVFSTSSPLVSVAAFDPGLVGAREAMRPGSAAGTCLEFAVDLLGTAGWSVVTGLVADVGPGGFSAVKVGVTLAKTLGFSLEVQVAGLSAFELIPGDGTKAVPYKRGAWLVRDGHDVKERAEWPEEARGYGGPEPEIWPHARAAEGLISRLEWTEPAELLPEYGAEPSISTPKIPFRSAPGSVP
jgi:hypothetical protein